MFRLFFFGFFLFYVIPSFGQPLSGTYTIGGSSPNYATWVAAVNDLKSKGVSGPVFFRIRDGVYLERISLDPIKGASAQNRITFESQSQNAAGVVITSAGSGTKSDHHTIRLKGADFVSFKNLTIENTGPNLVSGIHMLDTCNYIRIKGCRFLLDSTPTTVNNNSVDWKVGINIGGYDEGVSPLVFSRPNHGANYLEVDSCWFLGGSNGIYTNSGLVEKNFGQSVTHCVFKSQYAHALRINIVDSVTLVGNRIGMHLGNVRGTAIAVVFARPLVVAENYIVNAAQWGIDINGSSGKVYNNAVAGGFKTQAQINSYGITASSSVDFLEFYHNTVKMDAKGQAFHAYGSGLRMRVFNNIFYSSHNEGYAVHVDASGSINYSGNYNVLFTTGSFFARYQGSTYANLSAWQNGTGHDAQSLSLDPQFVSATDLHVTRPELDGKATASFVKYDLEGRKRSPRFPDQGAYEFVLAARDLGIKDFSVDPAADGPNTFKITVVNEGNQSLDGTDVGLQWSGNNGSTWSVIQNYPLSLMGSYGNERTYTHNTVWEIPSSGKYKACVRIQPPITGDALLKNDTLCQWICAGLRPGTYSVGCVGCDFPDLTQAMTYINALECGVGGSITLALAPGTYEEKVLYKPITGMGLLDSLKITTQSGKKDVVLRPKPDQTAIIKTHGGKNLVLEGLVFELKGSKDSLVALHMSGGAGGTVVRNCTFKLDPDSTGPRERTAILVSDSGNWGLGSSVGGLTVGQNQVIRGKTGIRVVGGAPKAMSFLKIRDNEFMGQGTAGLFLNNIGVLEVRSNTIRLDTVVGAENLGLYASNITTRADIESNTIYGAGFAGIFLELCQPSDTLMVYNNMIGGGWHATNLAYGIYLTQCRRSLLAFNSVLIDQGGLGFSSALQLDFGSQNRVLNNILANQGGGYAFFANDTLSFTSNYNHFQSTGANLVYAQKDFTGLSEYTTATGKDKNSQVGDPGFASKSNLHVVTNTVESKGVPVPGITRDIDGHVRSMSTPDIGADEFTLGRDLAMDRILSPVTTPCYKLGQYADLNVRIGNSGTLGVDSFGVKVYRSGILIRDTVVFQLIDPGSSWVLDLGKIYLNAKGLVNICAVVKVFQDQSGVNDSLCSTACVEDSATSIAPRDFWGSRRIYPNPVLHTLFLEWDKPIQQIQVWDVYGKEYHPDWRPISEHLSQVDLSPLLPGYYLLKARGPEHSFTVRLVRSN